jgi:NitT/TauT family transport system permease protein
MSGGIAVMLIGWQALSMHMHKAIVASPADTYAALQMLWTKGDLWHELCITLERLLTALSIGSLIGVCLGLAAGFSPLFRAFWEPLRWVIMSVPAIFIVVLGMLWFGMGSKQAVFLVTLVITPVIYVNTVQGVTKLDRQLIEMGRVYRFSWWQVLTEIYIPGISADILTGLTLATGIGVRAVVMAEMLGSFDGIGHSFNGAWTFLKTPDMFAWMLVCLIMMAILEFGILVPTRRIVVRWKQP